MDITLEPITKDNWEEAIELTVQEEQKRFVASNLYSIDAVQFLVNFTTVGIIMKERWRGLPCMVQTLMTIIFGFTA